MAVEITIKTCQTVGRKVLVVLALKNSQPYWGQPLTLALRGGKLRISASFEQLAWVEIPRFNYDSQFLARPTVVEFVNGNIGLGYWMDRQSAMIQGEDFEVVVKTTQPVLYEDYLKEKIEQQGSADNNNTQEESKMNNEQYIKGNTFDVFPGGSDVRYLFDFYLFDINTDEVIERGALIAPGDTIDEATRNAIQKMQAKVGDKVSSTIKVHLNYIKTFRKPKAEEDTFQKMADAIAKGVREGMKG